MMLIDLYAALSGTIVGLVLGLVGGGGSILAVPLLVYLVGVTPTHMALGTSAIAVALTALANIVPHWRRGNVKWRCAIVFALTGMAGAFAGSSLAKIIDGQALLGLFGLLMLVVGGAMLLGKGGEGDANIKLTSGTARILLPRLIPIGFFVGALSGFFGIGGGFLIVPGLIFATGMPMTHAVGTSLVAIFAFGSTTAFNYAISDLVDWRLAAMFVGGGAIGGVLGALIGKALPSNGNLLRTAFALAVIGIGGWIIYDGVVDLMARVTVDAPAASSPAAPAPQSDG